jgi:hypothetical protein
MLKMVPLVVTVDYCLCGERWTVPLPATVPALFFPVACLFCLPLVLRRCLRCLFWNTIVSRWLQRLPGFCGLPRAACMPVTFICACRTAMHLRF